MTLFVAHGKGSKSRWLSMSPQLLKALNDWGMPATGRLWDLDAAQVSHSINPYLHDVAGTPSTAHSLRHFYATKLYQLTKDIRLVQRALGHASVATSQIYAAPDMSQFASAVAAISFLPKLEVAPELVTAA
jgi:integrase